MEFAIDVTCVRVFTGSAVWDDPDTNRVVRQFPRNRRHRPTIGILDLGEVRPAANVLRNVIVTIGEDNRAGRYGNFSFVVSSQDEGTRNVVSDIASAQGLAIYVSSSPVHLEHAEPVGDLTVKD